MPSDYEQITKDNIRRRGEEFDDIGEFVSKELYSERTHFVFELLQNAEDKNATRITFLLRSSCLEVRHNGTRFDDADVRGICDVLKGTKANDIAKIGKFGIGFKSVYAFTSSPEIHSGDEHFYIERYIRPGTIPAVQLPTDETLFIFPFNHQDFSAEQAFNAIGARLRMLGPRTLHFLRSIDEIRWEIEGGEHGAYLREVQSLGPIRRVSVIGQSSTGENEEDWLIFERRIPIPGTDNSVAVEAAFRLVRDRESGTETIICTTDSELVVFFPTEKETHLGFLIQGPYRTTPARDNIKNDEWNYQLIRETASLVAEALPQLHEMNLLTVSLLDALANHIIYFPTISMFRPIYDSVRETLNEQPLLPAYSGGYVAAAYAKLARGTGLHELLSDHQLQELFGAGSEVKCISDSITQDRTPTLWTFLRKELGVDEVTPETIVARFTESFIEKQTDEWVVSFYCFLSGQQAQWRKGSNKSWDRPGPLRNKPFIRLEDGTHVLPFRVDGSPNAFLPTSEMTDYPIVKRAIVEDEQALSFLKALGLAEPDAVTEIIEKVLPKYLSDYVNDISNDEHARDIHRIAHVVWPASSYDTLMERLRKTPFLLAQNAATGQLSYRCPNALYVWRLNKRLQLYFDGNPQTWFLADFYQNLGDDSGDGGSLAGVVLCLLIDLVVDVGIIKSVRVHHKEPNHSGHVIIQNMHGDHKRGRNGFDPKCEIDGLEHALKNVTIEKAAFIWTELLVPHIHLIRGITEWSSRQSFEDPTQTEELSAMGKLVTSLPWLPSREGNFHKPGDLSLDDLPAEFQRNDALASALGMRAATLAALAREAGIEIEDLAQLKAHPQEFKEFLEKKKAANQASPQASEQTLVNTESSLHYAEAFASAFDRPGIAALADIEPLSPGPVTNPEQRRERVRGQILDDLRTEPRPEQRFARVERKVWEAKDNAIRTFLQEEYGGRCQICNGVFIKRNGQPYFEGLYLVSAKHARWIDRPGNVLCLCATCCAKFLYGAIEADGIMMQVQEGYAARGDPPSSSLQITLCGDDITIRFTERHMIDLQEITKVELNNV